MTTPNGLHLLLTGLALWVVGAAIGFFIPFLAPLAAVVALIGQILAFLGGVLIVVGLIRGA
jgi:hypothetical protein